MNVFDLTKEFTPVLDLKERKEQYVAFDLSTKNPELDKIDLSDSSAIQTYINDVYVKMGKRIAYGGYLETRGIYQRSSHFNQTDPLLERNIHLGIDLWAAAGTAVLAPIDGIIHSYANNMNFGDYGPTIILEHNHEGSVFYTLYGHLSIESIQGLENGTRIKKGERLAELGTDEVNGNYAPHLHFQIILDIENNVGDYPGVSNLRDIDFYKTNCPDPNLLLKIT